MTSSSRSCRCSGWPCSCVVARFGAREAMVDVSTDGEHWQGLLPRPSRRRSAGGGRGMPSSSPRRVALTTAGPFRVGVLSLVVPLVARAARGPRARAAPRGARRPRRARARASRSPACPTRCAAGCVPGSRAPGCCSASGCSSCSRRSRSAGPGSPRSRRGRGGRVRGRGPRLPPRCSRSATSRRGPCRSWPAGVQGRRGRRGHLVGRRRRAPADGAGARGAAAAGRVPLVRGPVGARRRRRGGLRGAPGAGRGGPALAPAHQAPRRPGSPASRPRCHRGCSTCSPAARSASSGSRRSGRPPVARARARSSSCSPGRSSSCSATRGGCAGERRHRATSALVVLVSGTGSNLQALLDAAAAADAGFRVLAVGADRDGTGGAERAGARGIPTFVARVPDYVTRADWDLDLARLIGEHGPDLVVSAGFMKVLGPAVLGAHRVVNTHPALLPSFPGAHGVRDAMAHGVRVTGCTCHWVDAGVDTGPIIDQRAVRGGGRRHRRLPPRADQGRRARDARRRRAAARGRPLLARRLTDSRRGHPSRRPRAGSDRVP